MGGIAWQRGLRATAQKRLDSNYVIGKGVTSVTAAAKERQPNSRNFIPVFAERPVSRIVRDLATSVTRSRDFVMSKI
uniref:Uncharacterized protein n=1 Tax=Ascaris lumbricoides TaxID=6252 RepID=A0A0M3HMT9_ASCLU